MPNLNRHTSGAKVLRFFGINVMPAFEDCSRFVATLTTSDIKGSNVISTYISKYNERDFAKILEISRVIFKRGQKMDENKKSQLQEFDPISMSVGIGVGLAFVAVQLAIAFAMFTTMKKAMKADPEKSKKLNAILKDGKKWTVHVVGIPQPMEVK